MGPELRAVIFDFDGTILDTESACYAAWQELYARHGCELPREAWQKVVGAAPGLFDPWAYLEAQLGRSLDRASLEAERRARELSLIAQRPLQEGVAELMEAVKAAGWRIGVATNSHRAWVERHLQGFPIRRLIDAVAAADDVERPKPDPALYTLAMRRLGVEPGEAVAIEDSPTGALSAKRAGLPCVVVPNEITRDYVFPEVDACWPTLKGVGPEELRAVWRSARRAALEKGSGL